MTISKRAQKKAPGAEYDETERSRLALAVLEIRNLLLDRPPGAREPASNNSYPERPSAPAAPQLESDEVYRACREIIQVSTFPDCLTTNDVAKLKEACATIRAKGSIRPGGPFPALDASAVRQALDVALLRLRALRNEGRGGRADATAAPAETKPPTAPVLSERAKKVFDYLSGRAATQLEIVNGVNLSLRTVGRALADLKKAELILKRTGGGYYRPDAPPAL